MAYKKGVILSERDKTVLRDFLAARVPAKYYQLDARGNTKFDFNYNYQEVYDYADALLHGQGISLNRNFLEQRSVAVNEEFRKILDVIGRRVLTLSDFCDKLAAATITIERLAKKD